MSESSSKLVSDYADICSQLIHCLTNCTAELCKLTTSQLDLIAVPWGDICRAYGGSSERFPPQPIQSTIDSYLLKLAVIAITADQRVSQLELEECFPLTSRIAQSLASQFSDLRGFDNSSIDRHCEFLRQFNEKTGSFGGGCDWTLAAAPGLVLCASVIQDASHGGQKRRALFMRFRALCIRLVRGILSSDGMTDEESILLQQISEHFDALLYSANDIEESNDPHVSTAHAQLLQSERNGEIRSTAATSKAHISREEALCTALEELNRLIGLRSVKQEVQRLTSFLRIQHERRGQNLKTATQSLHFVFKGNPGTGKTVVVRHSGQGLLRIWNSGLMQCRRV